MYFEVVRRTWFEIVQKTATKNMVVQELRQAIAGADLSRHGCNYLFLLQFIIGSCFLIVLGAARLVFCSGFV